MAVVGDEVVAVESPPDAYGTSGASGSDFVVLERVVIGGVVLEDSSGAADVSACMSSV